MAISSATTLAPTAVLDKRGNIVGVNRAWKAFGDRNGISDGYTFVGKNYVEISQQAGDEYSDRVVTELRRLLTDQQTEFTVVYPCHPPKQKRWFRLFGTTVPVGDDRYYLLVHQRLDRNPPSRDTTLSKVVDAPTRSVDHRNRSRLVTYTLSSGESATDGLLMAFDALGIDPESQGTTLQDWIDCDAINALQTNTSDFYITFTVFNYPVGMTPETVIIFTPEQGFE